MTKVPIVEFVVMNSTTHVTRSTGKNELCWTKQTEKKKNKTNKQTNKMWPNFDSASYFVVNIFFTYRYLVVFCHCFAVNNKSHFQCPCNGGKMEKKNNKKIVLR